MKKLWCLIFIFYCSIGFGQSNWTVFISNLSKLNFPIKIDSITKVQNEIISKNDVLNFLIIPATKFNKDKPESLQFEVDTALISTYNQWDNLDLNKKDTIDIYSPIGGGLIYCYKKIEISDDLFGVIWLFYRNMGETINFTDVYGIEYWLFVYDTNGSCKDFIQIAKKQSIGICEKCLFYKECLLDQTNTHKLILNFSEMNISPMKSCNYFDEDLHFQRNNFNEIYSLSNEGKFNLK